MRGKWRMGWDSNPRYACTHGGFQDRCLKPLGHPSSKLKVPYGFLGRMATVVALGRWDSSDPRHSPPHDKR